MSYTKKDKKMHALETEVGRKNLIKIYGTQHNEFSRRHFLSSGLMTLTASFLPVPLIQLITRQAFAADALDCPKEAGDFPIFVNIQLNGGPAMFAQHLASGSAGRALNSYAGMAMPTSPRRIAYFANKAPFWIDDVGATSGHSGMMEGLFKHLPRPNFSAMTVDPITNTSIPSALDDNINKDIHDNTAFVAVAAESVDDSFNNPVDLSGMLAACGIVGNALPHLLTGVGSFQGEGLGTTPIVQGRGAIIDSASMTNVFTTGSALVEDFLKNSVQLTGALATLPSPAAFTDAVAELSDIQLRAVANNPNSTESRAIFKRLYRCAAAQNKVTIAAGGKYNIYTDSTYPTNNLSDGNARTSLAVKDIWMKNKVAGDATARMTQLGLTAANMNTIIARVGTVVSACASGLGMACTINLGGYDYHQGLYSRADAHQKDVFFGDILGRCLRTAKAFDRKMFIFVTADGSVQNASKTNLADWTGEFFKRGMNYILAYNPDAVPVTAGLNMGTNNVDASFQLNQFDESQNVVKTINPIGNISSVDLCSAAVFLNYLNFAGKPEFIDKPAMAAVKKRLVDALPSGYSLLDYYTRIKS